MNISYVLNTALQSACELVLLFAVPAFLVSLCLAQLWQIENVYITWQWSPGAAVFDLRWHVSNADGRLSLSCSWLTGGLPAPREITRPRQVPPFQTQYIHSICGRRCWFAENPLHYFESIIQLVEVVGFTVANITLRTLHELNTGEGSDETAKPGLIDL